jgi:hypothetical protein
MVCLAQFISGNILSPCFAGLVFSVVTMALRHRDITLARRLIIPDCRRYDSLWAAVVADPSARPGLDALCACVADLARQLPRHPPRQHSKPRRRAPPLHTGAQAQVSNGGAGAAVALGGGGGMGGLARRVVGLLQWLASTGGALVAEGGGGRARPADCLDQLFVQAHRLHPILLAKVVNNITVHKVS